MRNAAGLRKGLDVRIAGGDDGLVQTQTVPSTIPQPSPRVL